MIFEGIKNKKRNEFVGRLLKNYRLSPDREKAKKELATLRAAVQNGEVSTQEIADFLRNVDTGVAFAKTDYPQKDVARRMITDFGWRDLSNARIGAHKALRPHRDVWDDFHLTKTLDGLRVVDADLRNANLDNADLTLVDLAWTKLDNAHIPRIRVRGKSIDMLHDAITVRGESPWVVTNDAGMVGTCSMCELTNEEILSMINTARLRARRGVVLFWENKPIGYMKLKGENSFLAMRTVHDKNSVPIFYKGMVYSLGRIKDKESGLREHTYLSAWISLQSQVHSGATQWRKLRVEDIVSRFPNSFFYVNHMRLISNPKIFTELDTLVKRIENGEEEMVDISPEKEEKRSFRSRVIH